MFHEGNSLLNVLMLLTAAVHLRYIVVEGDNCKEGLMVCVDALRTQEPHLKDEKVAGRAPGSKEEMDYAHMEMQYSVETDAVVAVSDP